MIRATSPSRMVRATGFGMTEGGDVYLYRPTNVQEVKDILQMARETGRQVVLRGSGRSYGDANIARECLMLDISRMNQIYSINKQSGEVDCQAGVTIEQLWRATLEDGFWPPIVSGTMAPTLAGALGMNIHGKNAYVAGPIGEHVTEMDVVLPNGDVRTLKPESPLFHAVISSAGLLGVITRVRLKMKRIKSGDLRVLPLSVPDWEGQFKIFEDLEHDADYMVTWIDCFGRGQHAGRGVFHAAWYTHEDEEFPSTLRPENQDLPDTILGFFPKSVVWRFLKPLNNRFGMRALNAAKHHASRLLGNGKQHAQGLVGFSFLLDYVPNWRKAYLPGGFIQYQSFVPKEHALRVFAEQVRLQQEAKLESFLGVMKRHKPDDFLFSHGVDGYSLALDFKVTRRNRERLWQLAHTMNDLVVAAGGKFYLAKDSTLRPEDFRATIGDENLARYFGLKAELDPDSILTSCLAKRLGLDPRELNP
jgi:decaprenylphospho-beta-D-ribofuranose 2-oxidase